MFALPGGAWVIDTPGMRELKVGQVENGLSETFKDIEALALDCRFRDCDHVKVAGCALVAAVHAANTRRTTTRQLSETATRIGARVAITCMSNARSSVVGAAFIARRNVSGGRIGDVEG